MVNSNSCLSVDNIVAAAYFAEGYAKAIRDINPEADFDHWLRFKAQDGSKAVIHIFGRDTGNRLRSAGATAYRRKGTSKGFVKLF